jgi:hypothetical protein
MASQLRAFLSGEAQDSRGRTAADLIALSDEQLEQQHDWVQWLFPLPTPSAAVPGSPYLSPDEIEAIRSDARARDTLFRAADRMIVFYRRTDHWLAAHDHNHLRITHIIRSLGLLVSQDEARRFYRRVMTLQEAAGRPVNEESLRYWKEAVGG